jgi:ubiquinone/menaquinone biosynthesis C-methylase UbiE
VTIRHYDPLVAPAAFDRFAADYENALNDAIAFAGAPHDVYVSAKVEALLRLVRRRLIGAPSEALDVGCGVGLTDRHLLSHVGTLHGVDVSEEMVAVARERNPDVEYRTYDGSALPYDEGRFDLVFAICVLHHVAPAARPALFGELRRVVRPGGLITVFEHNPLNPLTRRVVRSCRFDEDVELLGRRRLAESLRAARVEVTDQEYLLFFPWRGNVLRALERRLARVPLGAQYVVAGRRTS